MKYRAVFYLRDENGEERQVVVPVPALSLNDAKTVFHVQVEATKKGHKGRFIRAELVQVTESEEGD